jgi:hypothetical protein
VVALYTIVIKFKVDLHRTTFIKCLVRHFRVSHDTESTDRMSPVLFRTTQSVGLGK